MTELDVGTSIANYGPCSVCGESTPDWVRDHDGGWRLQWMWLCKTHRGLSPDVVRVLLFMVGNV